jgi:hypothetical protein
LRTLYSEKVTGYSVHVAIYYYIRRRRGKEKEMREIERGNQVYYIHVPALCSQ